MPKITTASDSGCSTRGSRCGPRKPLHKPGQKDAVHDLCGGSLAAPVARLSLFCLLPSSAAEHEALDAQEIRFRVDAGPRPGGRPPDPDPDSQFERAKLLELLDLFELRRCGSNDLLHCRHAVRIDPVMM